MNKTKQHIEIKNQPDADKRQVDLLVSTKFYNEDGIALYNADYIEVIDSFAPIDLVVTDPPYNFESYGGGFYKEGSKNSREYLTKLRNINCDVFAPGELLSALDRVMPKFNGVFFCNKFLVDEYTSWAREHNYNFDIHVMAKSNPIPAKNNHFLHDLEYIVVIRETGAYFSANAPHKDYHKYSIVKSRTDNLHPAQKPIDVIAKYIRVLSEVGGRIADPFCGSGTTLLAARELGRKAIGAEINLEYCKMTRDRLNQMDLF